MKQQEIPPPVDSSIRLFSLCQVMEFRHLPVAGGIYDQNPELLERFQYIWAKLNEQREREEAQRERNRGGPAAAQSRLRRGASRPSY